MRSYLTTPIYYVNGPPHLGHAFTSVAADILARQRGRLGIATLLSTGCDEHGQKNDQAAQAADLTAQSYLDLRSAEFRALFDRLAVLYDVFVRTSSTNHLACVQEAATRLNDAGLLFRKAYEGHYCAGCEQFKRQSDIDVDGHCREHPNLIASLIREENYFLAIEPFREAILQRILLDPSFVQPQSARAQLLALLDEPLEDLCISRPASRVPLGVRLPFDSNYVAYVWFDALINYLGNVKWPHRDFKLWWPEVEHVIGKDILKTHGIYWPAILLALGEALPKTLSVHSHWTGEGGLKMSKSLGNVVDPNKVIDTLGPDALRYFFARQMRLEADSAISTGLIRQTYVAELANKLGNLHSRLLKFASSKFGGRVPQRGILTPADKEIRAAILLAARYWASPMKLEDIPVHTTAQLDAVQHLNRYLTEQAPWSLATATAPAERCRTITYVAMDCLRLIFEALWPVIPSSAERGLMSLTGQLPATMMSHWLPCLDALREGTLLGEASILFPKPDP